MKIGIPKERKIQEYRVGCIPSGVQMLIDRGHDLYFEKDCGKGSGFSNDEYLSIGAKPIEKTQELYDISDIV